MPRKNRRRKVTAPELGDYVHYLHAPNGDLVAALRPAANGETVVDLFRPPADIAPADRERLARDFARVAPEWTHDEAYDLLWGD